MLESRAMENAQLQGIDLVRHTILDASKLEYPPS
jgi:hypothetical protein